MYAEPTVLEGLHHGATTMLAYFHYKNKGELPFNLGKEARTSKDNKSDWVELGHMDADQIEFIEHAFEEIRRRSMLSLKREESEKEMLTWNLEPEIDAAKERKIYHDEMFFVSQMFDANWRPVVTEPFKEFEE